MSAKDKSAASPAPPSPAVALAAGFAPVRAQPITFWRLNVALFGSFIRAVVAPWHPASRPLARAAFEQLFVLGYVTLLLTLVVCTLLCGAGASFALGTPYAMLYRTFLPEILGRVFISQVAPLVAAFLVISRSIVAMTAELASMRVSQEIDALEVLGVDPVGFLLLPRALALFVAMPATVLFAIYAALVGGWLATRMRLGSSLPVFTEAFFRGSDAMLLCIALGETLLAAWWVLTVGGYFGLNARTDRREGVGRAVRFAVVYCVLGVALLHFIATMLGQRVTAGG